MTILACCKPEKATKIRPPAARTRQIDWQYQSGDPDQRGPSLEKKWSDSPRHYQNFVDCVKSRRSDELIADIEEGHLSALLCHIGNIAFRTGRRLEFDPKTETFSGDPEANALLTREYRKGFELSRI